MYNTPILQFGEDGSSYLDNEMDIYANWRLHDDATRSSKIFFWGLYVQTFSAKATGGFAGDNGLIIFPNGGATDPDDYVVAPSALWYEETFKQPGITYRVGQLYAPALWGSNTYLNDDRENFMNSVLHSNQGTPWASGSRGIGAMVTWAKDDFYVSAGFQDAKANQTRIDVRSFQDGRYMYLAELGLTPTFGKLKGTYKFTVGSVDQTTEGGNVTVDQKEGHGYIFSAEQDIAPNTALFAVYRGSEGRYVNNTKAAGGVGVTFKAPFGWDDDKIGVGAFFADPYDKQGGKFREEYGIEAYYNIQLTPRVAISPNIQWYAQPGHADYQGDVTVVGLRLKFIL